MIPADLSSPPNGPMTASDLAPTPLALLTMPLDFIAAEHVRQRCVTAHFKRIASSKRVDPRDADALVHFLTHDLVMHHNDEDQDLFPALLRRAHSEDGIAAIIASLNADHRLIGPQVDTILASFRRRDASGAVRIKPACEKAMSTYSFTMHRHLSVENSIVLVIARKRLTPADLGALSSSMAARRGIVL